MYLFKSRSLLAALLVVCWPAFADIEIKGVSGEIARAIRDGLSVKDDCNQPRWLTRYRFRASEQEVRTILETYGYYGARISSELEFEESCWRATFNVDRGTPVTIRRAGVRVVGEGAVMGEFAEVISNGGVRAGLVFDHQKYEALKSSLEEVAARLGFLESKFTTRSVVVNPGQGAVDVDIVLDTGPRYRFGDVVFLSDALSEDLLRRYANFQKGDPYNADQVGDLYQSLAASGYFQDIVIDTSKVVGQEITVEIRLETGKASLTRVGAGYSTDLGPSAFISRNSRFVNRKGHQLKLELSVSPVESKLGGIYRIPQADVAEGWYSLYGGFERENNDTSDTRKTSLGVRHVRPRGGGWVETRFFEALSYQFDVGGEGDSSHFFTPGVNFSHTEADNATARPGRAHRFDLEISGASASLGSTEDYLRTTASVKLIKALGPNLRVIGRAKAGAVINNNFDVLPPDVRFFAGGDNSVRGYDLDEIGVLNADGEVIGGDRMIEASAEFDYLFRPAWALATFIDAGSVSLGSFSEQFNRSAGVGIRWYSPIGPVRFDIATPLGDGGKSFRIHIRLGPDI